MNAERWQDIQTHMMGYWNREAMERCCVAIRVSKPGFKEPAGRNYYYDAVSADRSQRARFPNKIYMGEAFPYVFPTFGTAGVAEYTGCKAVNAPDTTWFEPWLEEPEAEEITYRCPEIFARQKATMEELVGLAKGEYLVTPSDNCGVLDALAAIRGTDELMMDMIADPEFVEEALQKLLPIYKETQEQIFTVLKENNHGSVHSWMQLWAPQRLAQMQCDLSVMISPEMFNQFAMPELEELSSFLDYPVYHLDGQEQIRHLDSLLSLKKLRAIQWTPVAGQPETSTFIPVLQRIQKAGKNLVLIPRPHEVEKLLDNLSCRGLHMIIDGLKNEEEALEMLELVKKHSKDRAL